MYLSRSLRACGCYLFVLLLASSSLLAADNESTQLPTIEATASPREEDAAAEVRCWTRADVDLGGR